MDINLGNPLKFPQSEFKTQMESEIRSRCSEGVLFELHDRLFTDLKNLLKPISQSLGTRQISE